jgi:hypothetical protein
VFTEAGVLGGSGGKAADEAVGFASASGVLDFILTLCCAVETLRTPGVERLPGLLPVNGLDRVAGVKFETVLNVGVIPLGPRGISASLSLPFSSLGNSPSSKAEPGTA